MNGLIFIAGVYVGIWLERTFRGRRLHIIENGKITLRWEDTP